jgi:hypothetical protein
MCAVACGGTAVAAGTTGAAGATHAASAVYWTRARMERAVPMQAEPAATSSGRASGPGGGGAVVSGAGAADEGAGGVVARDTGKVFFDLDGNDYVCSGAAVGGPRVSVVVTAAHCVTDGYGGYATHWMFVPGYANGDEPYGSYPSSRFFVSKQWNAGLDEMYDVAFVTVNGLSGGLPVGFDASPRSVYVFGYPADPPFSGGSLRYCAGPVSQDPQDPGADSGIRCDMTAGDSGGPWLTGFRAATGTGTVVAISAFKYSDNDQTLYGTLLGRTARELYREALAATAR